MTEASNLIHTGIDTISDSELLESPFDMASTPPAAKVFSTLEELMQGHKPSLGLDEDNVKSIRAYREEFWNETIVIFKHPRFDFTTAPRVSFVGELSRCRLWRVGERIWNTVAEANLFEGPEERKLPLYLIDGLYSRLFERSGKMVSYLIIHLDIGIPCLSPAAYNYIATASVTPECCSVDDVVDLEIKEQIIQMTKL